LLTQRILALLARVERPEEVLAITFTRKAAAEMRQRLLRALTQAENPQSPTSLHEQTTWQLARAVLEQDSRHDWQLLRNPNRLQLVTIDSFCAHLVRRMPWLSRFGAPPAICEDPRDDYRLAAERLLLQGLSGSAVRQPVALLLRHLDNRLDLLRDMLVEMLARRDQWLRHLLGQRHEQSRAVLEGGLRGFVASRLRQLEEMFSDPLKHEWLQLACFAGSSLAAQDPEHRFAPLSRFDRFPAAEPEYLDDWLLLSELFLTQAGKARARLNKNQGFPADKSARSQEMKQRGLQLLEQLQDDPDLVDALNGLRRLPRIAYFDHQWQVLQALVDLLPVAAAELDRVFREQGHIDFIAIASGARVALGDSDSPEELLLQLDSRISHILIDEFQDTSFGQYELLERLVAGWQQEDGRTLFLVGDPMQSIYRFREAEVGLFLRAMQRGVGNVTLEPLRLSVNFRSQAGLVAWNNQLFAALFPTCENEALGAVTYAASSAHRPELSASPAEVVLLAQRDDRREAQLVVDSIVAGCTHEPQASHAVLVRSRSHAREIAVTLRQSGIRYQAQELEPLDTRQAILDLLALTRALVHPGDRLAWLAVLRAPWCGLRLESLLTLCEGEKHAPLWTLIRDPARLNWLENDERQRLTRLSSVFSRSLQRRGREPLARVVKATWLALGGPACGDDSDCEDAAQYLRLLSEFEQGGELLNREAFEQALARLFAAPDPDAGPQVQIMTIHKAKGLEFDHVYLPGLGRSVRGQQKVLLRWLEHPDHGLMLAPVPSSTLRGEDATYAAIGGLHASKDAYETLRLLYVACTRARAALHLFGHVGVSDDELSPPANSLLQVAWEALEVTREHIVESTPHDEADPGPRSPGLLRRLPGDWELPVLSELSRADGAAHRVATDHPASQQAHLFSAGESRRIAGTVVHLWLERIARQGLEAWSTQRLQEQQGRIMRHLTTLGCPGKQVVEATQSVLDSLCGALSGEQGRWILQAHDAAECEVALSAEIDGVQVEAVVDRTFVTPEGVRWVIDYKTSAPAAGESHEDFLRNELEAYRHQVTTYLKIFSLLEPERKVVGALYFPRLDAMPLIDS